MRYKLKNQPKEGDKKQEGGSEYTLIAGKWRETHYKHSRGYESWYEYDEQGNQVYYKNSYRDEVWYEYDDKGNEVHYQNSNGDEVWKEYDEKGNCVHYKDSNGNEYWFNQDEEKITKEEFEELYEVVEKKEW